MMYSAAALAFASWQPALIFRDTSYNHYYHTSNNSWCVGSLSSHGLGPDIDTGPLNAPGSGKLAVGFAHYFDPGTDPFPCPEQAATYYRGGVAFDMNALSNFVKTNGLKSVSLEFRLDSGNGSCIDHIGVDSDVWENLRGSTGDMPDDGGLQLHPNVFPLSSGALQGEVAVTAPIALSIAFGGGTANPHLHFVFVGTNENIYAQDNNMCDSIISTMFLVVTPKGS
jgi:hypothetical protein